MGKNLRIIFSFGLVGAVLLLSGCIFQEEEKGYSMDLEIWGAIDDSETLESIFQEYRKINPYVKGISYKKMAYDRYKDDVIDALASGQGPDIFLIDNNWLPYFKNKIEPAPDYLVREVDVQSQFVDVVAKDFVEGGKVYGLPLSVDSLGLYCNRDLFNAAGITAFPATWEELREDVRKLTRIDEVGEFTQSGVALGTAQNISRPADLVSLLMLQKGTAMTNPEGTMATFNYSFATQSGAAKPGVEALEFYTQFANSSSPYYTWNSRKHHSVDAFSEGTVAMMLNYSWQAPVIRNKNSKLSFTVVPVPQFQGSQPLDLAYYSGFVVSKNRNRPKTDGSGTEAASPEYNRVRIHEAWELVKFLTFRSGGKFTLMNGLTRNTKEFPLNIDPAEEYLKATARPAARRDLVEKQKNDPFLAPFATDNLIATSWKQADPLAVNGIFTDMIDEVNRGSASANNAIETAVQRVNNLMRSY